MPPPRAPGLHFRGASCSLLFLRHIRSLVVSLAFVFAWSYTLLQATTYMSHHDSPPLGAYPPSGGDPAHRSGSMSTSSSESIPRTNSQAGMANRGGWGLRRDSSSNGGHAQPLEGATLGASSCPALLECCERVVTARQGAPVILACTGTHHYRLVHPKRPVCPDAEPCFVSDDR